MVPHHGGAFGAACPVLARAVLAGCERSPVRLRAGEHVVLVGRVATPVDRVALLADRGRLAELVVGAVQVSHALRDDLALVVAPRARADAVASIDGRLAVGGLRAEI